MNQTKKDRGGEKTNLRLQISAEKYFLPHGASDGQKEYLKTGEGTKGVTQVPLRGFHAGPEGLQPAAHPDNQDGQQEGRQSTGPERIGEVPKRPFGTNSPSVQEQAHGSQQSVKEADPESDFGGISQRQRFCFRTPECDFANARGPPGRGPSVPVDGLCESIRGYGAGGSPERHPVE